MSNQTISYWLQINNFPASIEGELKKFNVESVNQIKSKSCLELMFMLEFIVQSDSFKNRSGLIIPFKSAIYNVHSNIKDSKYPVSPQKQYGGYGGYGSNSGYGGYGGYGGETNRNSAWGNTGYNSSSGTTYDSAFNSGGGWGGANKSSNSGWGGNKWSGNKWGGNKWSGGGNKWSGSNSKWPQIKSWSNSNANKSNGPWRICWDFKSGQCQRGSTCQWSHSALASKKGSGWRGSGGSGWSAGGQSGGAGGGQQGCWDFTQGRCARGNTCQWLHTSPSSNKREYEAKRQDNRGGHAQKENKNKNAMVNTKPVTVESHDQERKSDDEHESDDNVIAEINLQSKTTPGNDIDANETKDSEESKGNNIKTDDVDAHNEDDENKERDSVSGLSNEEEDEDEEDDEVKDEVKPDDANAESEDEPCW